MSKLFWYYIEILYRETGKPYDYFTKNLLRHQMTEVSNSAHAHRIRFV
jgi:hypothetical protein